MQYDVYYTLNEIVAKILEFDVKPNVLFVGKRNYDNILAGRHPTRCNKYMKIQFLWERAIKVQYKYGGLLQMAACMKAFFFND